MTKATPPEKLKMVCMRLSQRHIDKLDKLAERHVRLYGGKCSRSDLLRTAIDNLGKRD